MSVAAPKVGGPVEGEPPVRPRRVATVDVGTNSIRLMVAEAFPDGHYKLLDDEKVVAGLGRGMSRAKTLDPERMEKAARIIAHLRAIADGHGVEALRAVATFAVREAENREEFLELVRREAGLDLEVISGEEEARLAYLSVRRAFDLEHREVAVVDLGGGSTEVILCAGGLVEHVSSVSLGAVSLTEAMNACSLSPSGRLKQLRSRVRSGLKGRVTRRGRSPELVIGTGGTFTTLAGIEMNRRQRDAQDSSTPSVRGYQISISELRRRLETLNAMTVEQRMEVPGLNPDRAEIIVAGLAIVEGVMRRLQVKQLQVHDRGIRDGLLLTMTHDLFPDAARKSAPNRLEAARRLARACRYEEQHSQHVTTLAMQIYDQLVRQIPDLPEHVRSPESRALLEAASVLHDVGYMIAYAKHHKHSEHLIVHSEMVGFDHRELAVVANIARYHRRAHPKKSHRSFRTLSAADQELVRHLSAILRVADGLDRAHAGNVHGVRVEIARGTAWFHLESDQDAAVEIWGAARKSQLFAQVYDVDPRFESES